MLDHIYTKLLSYFYKTFRTTYDRKDSNARLLIAENGGQVVGCLGVRISMLNAKEIVSLSSPAVVGSIVESSSATTAVITVSTEPIEAAQVQVPACAANEIYVRLSSRLLNISLNTMPIHP